MPYSFVFSLFFSFLSPLVHVTYAGLGQNGFVSRLGTDGAVQNTHLLHVWQGLFAITKNAMNQCCVFATSAHGGNSSSNTEYGVPITSS